MTSLGKSRIFSHLMPLWQLCPIPTSELQYVSGIARNMEYSELQKIWKSGLVKWLIRRLVDKIGWMENWLIEILINIGG